jgi:hypothetical protein
MYRSLCRFIQLHINDSRGTDFSGKGMDLSNPITSILRYIKNSRKHGEVVRATVELKEGHLYNGELQKRAVEWLLVNAIDVLY